MPHSTPLLRDSNVVLRSGATIPAIGLGTSGDALIAVASALEAGYRLIDTAHSYDNEADVGMAVRASGISRDELFITSKFSREDHSADGVERALERSLVAMGLDYLDLLLVHWPNPQQDRYVDAWRGLVKLQQDGQLRSIGVSNFRPHHLERIIDATGVAPDVNQIELNPHVPRAEARAFHARYGIVTEAWSPLGRGEGLLDDAELVAVAARIGRTPAQVVLRWHIQNGVIPIPRSSSPERQRANLDVWDFELTTSDMDRIARLDRGERCAADSNQVVH